MLLNIVVKIIDPLILVPSQVQYRVKQEEHNWTKNTAKVHFYLAPVTYTLLFILFDLNRNPIISFVFFRFGIALSLLIMGISLRKSNNTTLIKFCLYLACLIISLLTSWAMTLGYPMQSIWVVFYPTIILATLMSSLILSISWIILIVIISSPYWSVPYPGHFMITNSIAAIFILSLSYVTKLIWIKSKINQFLNDDLVAESIEKQIEFDNEIKRFISPVLVERIEEKTSSGQTLVMALDDVLMRKDANVAVMFTDMRNFSTRSVDTDFVEKELVPSSSKIIDSSEDNMGVAKQIGDAVFVYYAMEDPEEGLLRATKDAVAGCIDEKRRIKELGRQIPERFFSLAYGSALVGNMASFRHREATVIGSPANLAARMDSLTKEPAFKPLIDDGNKVLLSKTAKELMQTFHDSFEFNEINLEDMGLIMKSFPDEKNIYLLPITKNNIARLNDVLLANNIKTIEAEA